MPTFYLSNLNPGSTALGDAAAFTGAVTAQPSTSSANQTGTGISADTVRAYFRYYTNSNSDTVAFDISEDTVDFNNHGYANGSQIEFSAVTNSGGAIVANTKYYVVNTATNTFKLAATVNGSAITMDGNDGTGTISTLAVNGVTSGSNGAFAFTNPAALQTDFLSLLATEVFGSSEAADLFSNTADLRTSHTHAVNSCITKLQGLVNTSGAAASSELIDAMMLASNATNHRFTLPYKASMRTANDIVTADDLNVADFSCTFTTSGSVITTPLAHGLNVNDKIFFTDSTNDNVTVNTIYFVLTTPAGGVTFTIGTSEGGGAVTLAASDGHGGFCAARSVTFTIATDLVGLSAHGYVANQKIEFNNVVTTTGVAADTTYYVRANNMTANAFEISASEATYTITAADNKFTLASHGYTNGNTIVFSSITSTTGFDVNTTYYIVGVSGDDFQISTSAIGAAISLTTDGSATAAGAVVDLATGDGKGAIRVVPSKVDVIAQAVVVNANDTISLTDHGYSNGDQIQFARSATSDITVGTVYFIREKTDNTFKVATTSIGDAVEIGDSGASTALIVKSMNVATHECIFTAATDLVTFQSGHGYVDHDMITFSSVNTTTGISVDTIYYLRDKSGDTFKLALTRGGSALNLSTDGNGIISKTVLGANKTYYTDTQTRHVMGLTSGSAQAALSMALNPVQAAMLNGSLNDSTNPTEVPLETDDVLRMLFTITSEDNQEDTSGDAVTATQTFFLDYTLT